MNFPVDAISSPLGVAIIAGVILGILGWSGRKIFGSGDLMNPTAAPEAKAENTSTQSTTVTNNFFPSPPTTTERTDTPGDDKDVLVLKSKVRILFIENGTFKQISNLKNQGWSVQQIKDVTDLDSSEIRTSHIIFVDYKDVGQQLSDEEGLGVVKALKQRYGATKWVILYSAHPFLLDVFDREADSFLAKNSTFIEIEQKIIEGAHVVVK